MGLSMENSWEKSRLEEGNVLGVPRGTCVLGTSPEVGYQPQKEFPIIANRLKNIPEVAGVTEARVARRSSVPLQDPEGLAALQAPPDKGDSAALIARDLMAVSGQTRPQKPSPGGHGLKLGSPWASPWAGKEETRPASCGVDLLESFWALGDLPLPG